MWTLIPSILLFITAGILVVLHQVRPSFRFTWLIAVNGALLALVVVLFWRWIIPNTISLPSWQPSLYFAASPSFMGDQLAWLFGICLTVLALAILLTAGVREDFQNSFIWPGLLIITGIGMLSVSAANPLTLVLVWSSLDLTELIIQLRSVSGPKASESVVIAFSTRVVGSGLLIWANLVSLSKGIQLDFSSVPQQAGVYLIAAAGLRLGVLPLHLPYRTETVLRRGFGTALRMVTAASSLVLLARVPPGSVDSPVSPILLIFAALAAVYGGWQWLRSPDALNGRPYWMIGLAALAVSAALRENPIGAAALGCALILSGAVLFLTSIQNIWLNRALLAGIWGFSSLPFSLTAVSWLSTARFQLTLPLLIIAQGLLIAGYIRHSIQSGKRAPDESLPAWTRILYPAGIVLLLAVQAVLGFWGWDGAWQIGLWPVSMTACILAFALVWAGPRLRVLQPIRLSWNARETGWLDGVYGYLWSLYRLLGRLSRSVLDTFEGDGGVMWTLLFLALFVSLMIQGAP